MRKDIAKKWIKALKSGKYKQGNGYLKQFNGHDQPRHCCLGVLCELYNDTMKKNHKKTLSEKKREFKNFWNGIKDNYRGHYSTFNNKEGGLPICVKKWAGIKNELGIYNYMTKDRYGEVEAIESLADLNDSGKKFSTIADIIAKNVENL